nr:reverse transcriptase domain-containing protein [Tanacetum cinerariifolium]
MEKFFQIFQDLYFDISFVDALLLMLKFASTIKRLLANKDKLFELAKTPLNENCSAMLLKKLPEKLGDPDKFLIPCDFLGMDVCHDLADLVDQSITHPKGVAKDIFVKVGKFHFPTDVVVVDFEAGPQVPLILRRSFLRTGHALIDVYREEITLQVNDEAVTFNLNQTTRYSSTYDDMSVNQIDVIDVSREEYAQEMLGFSKNSLGCNLTLTFEPIISDSSHSLTPFEGSNFILEEIEAYLKDESISPKINHADCDPEGDIRLIEKLLNDEPFQLSSIDLKQREVAKAKSTIKEPSELELKDLASHLEYAYLEGADKLPVIIAKDLKDDEKEALLKLVPDDDKAIDYETLDVKSLIINCESQVLGTNEVGDVHVYKLTRLDGSYRYFLTFSRMLEVLDRQDVLDLHKIITERFPANDPEGYDLILWGDLKTLVESSKDDEIWRNQQDWKLLSWKLYETCGVHTLMLDDSLVSINMVVEKRNMNPVNTQQVALDNSLVAHEKRLKIEKCNARITEHLLQSSIGASMGKQQDLIDSGNHELKSLRKEHIPYLRFTKVIINHFISMDNNISMRNMINLHTICDDSLLGTLKFVSKTQDYQQYGAVIPDDIINQDIKDSKAYKIYYDFANGKSTHKQAKKYKKIASPSRKLSLILEEEPAEKPKGKGIDLLFDASLLEADQVKEALKKSKKESHMLHPGGSGDGVGSQPKIPVESEDKTTGTDKGTSTKPGVPDVPKYLSESKNESWGDSGDDGSNDNDSDEVTKDDDEDDVESDANEDKDDSDNEKTDCECDELYKDVDVKSLDAEREKEKKGDAKMTNDDNVPPADNEVTSMINVKKAQAEKEKYINIIEKSVKEIIKDEFKSQLSQILPKEISDFATPVIQSTINKSLENRGRKDKDKDEDPPTRSDQGLKKRKMSKDAEPPKGFKSRETKSSSSKGTKSHPKTSGKSVQVEELVFETADTKMPQDQGDDLDNTKDQSNVEEASKHDWFKKPERPPTPDHDWNVENKLISDLPRLGSIKWLKQENLLLPLMS